MLHLSKVSPLRKDTVLARGQCWWGWGGGQAARAAQLKEKLAGSSVVASPTQVPPEAESHQCKAVSISVYR